MSSESAQQNSAHKRRVPAWLPWLLAACALLVAGFVFLLPWILPRGDSPRLWFYGTDLDESLTVEERAALIQSQVQASAVFVQILAGAFLIGTVVLAYQTYKQTQAQLELTREQIDRNAEHAQAQLEQTREELRANQEHAEKQLDIAQRQLRSVQDAQLAERFTRAVDQLGATRQDGSPATEIRLGGIYALERIAIDEPEPYYATVIEVLTAYVRLNAPPPKDDEPSSKDDKPAPEIQTILTVIGRRSPE